jgi:hypothetical protein
MKTKKDRSHRLSKKLHKKYLSDTRLYTCSSEEWLDTLTQANDGQIFYIKNNEKTPTLKKITDKNLNYQVTKISTKPDQSFDIEISPCKFRELILRSTIFPPNSDSAIEAIRLAEQRTLSEKTPSNLTPTPLHH